MSSIRAESEYIDIDIDPVTKERQKKKANKQTVRALQSRKRFLASSLLSSDALQKHLHTHVPAARRRLARNHSQQTQQNPISDPSPLLQTANVHAQTNQHRIAFSTTTFPFRDRDAGRLLGVRIDVCTRGGRFVKPYYVLLRRVAGPEGHSHEGGDAKLLQVHRHTIPAFISMQRLERIYLPLPTGDDDANEDESLLKPWKAKSRSRRQNLASFVRVLRRSLTAWHLRQDAVVHLRERLGVRPDLDDEGEGEENGSKKDDKWALPENNLGLVSLGPTTLEARYIRLEWEDGRVGRFKVSDSGRVERAVVIGDRGRDKALESVLTDGQARVEDVVDSLIADVQ